MNKKITAFACLGIALGIVLGAFGAHGLRQVTDDASIMNSYKTGVDYHLFHSVAFLIFGLLGTSVLAVPIRKSALTLIFYRDSSIFWILVSADMVSIERMELCLARTHHADGRHTLDCRMGLVGLFLASP